MARITKIELNIGLEHGRADGEQRAYDTPEAIETRGFYCVNTAIEYLKADGVTGLRFYEGDGEAGVAVALRVQWDSEDALRAEIDKLCKLLGQEAIAARYYVIYNKQGAPRERWREALIGPRADEWGPFNADLWQRP